MARAQKRAKSISQLYLARDRHGRVLTPSRAIPHPEALAYHEGAVASYRPLTWSVEAVGSDDVRDDR